MHLKAPVTWVKTAVDKNVFIIIDVKVGKSVILW